MYSIVTAWTIVFLHVSWCSMQRGTIWTESCLGYGMVTLQLSGSVLSWPFYNSVMQNTRSVYDKLSSDTMVHTLYCENLCQLKKNFTSDMHFCKSFLLVEISMYSFPVHGIYSMPKSPG